MTLYSLALFVHIVGALLLCTAFTVEGIGLFHVRRATTSAQVREWEGVTGLGRAFGPASVVTILASGLYMMIASWGWVPWIAVGLFSWILIAVLGAVNGIRLSGLVRRAASDPAAIIALRSRSFVISWVTRVGIAVGVVFLMTNKPELVWAVLCVLAAAAIGAALGVLASRPAPSVSARSHDDEMARSAR